MQTKTIEFSKGKPRFKIEMQDEWGSVRSIHYFHTEHQAKKYVREQFTAGVELVACFYKRRYAMYQHVRNFTCLEDL
jgi:hypothetical protein